MRHGNRGRKFHRTAEHRKAMFSNLAGALIKHEQITTTLHKAKDLRPIVEKLVTLGKKGGLHARRQAYSYLCDHQMVKYLFDEIAPRFKDMNGGYTRVLKFVKRKGDDAQLSILELTVRKEKSAVKAEAPAAEAEGEKKGLKGIFKKKAAKKAE